jgi:hypothetical protein
VALIAVNFACIPIVQSSSSHLLSYYYKSPMTTTANWFSLSKLYCTDRLNPCVHPVPQYGSLILRSIKFSIKRFCPVNPVPKGLKLLASVIDTNISEALLRVNDIVVGSDEEKALVKAIKSSFPNSELTLCTRHLNS